MHPATLPSILAVAFLVAACAPSGAAPASPVSAPAPAVAPRGSVPVPQATSAPAEPESLDALAEKARAEGGVLSLYGTINPNTAAKIFAAFEARFAGIKIEWVDAISERLVARIISEARGGKVLADVLQTGVENGVHLRQQNLLADFAVPEAGAYPDALKSSYWLPSDVKFFVVGRNTNLVPEGEEPNGFEDLADPKWRNRLIADPVDVELLIVLAKHKYQSDDQAIDLLRRIAANNPEFHKGHSELAELLVAGHGAVCVTCFSHHFPPRMKRGAPIDYQLGEGTGSITANVVLKGAPHPNTALLWVRWVASEEGQRVYAEAGNTPAHPNVPPLEKTRPERIYPLTPDDVRDFPRYQRLWQEIFQVR